jgi:DNA-binding PadR family transcriptional regulator
MHGYQVITELGERSGGVWRPSPGSIYPTLQALADQGLVTSEETDGRRVFSLTDAGRAEVENTEQAARPAPWEAIAASVDEGVVALRSRAGQVFSATTQVAQFGSPAQIERAGQILADARRALYGLLAEDEPANDGSPDGATEPADGEEISPEG